MAIQDGDGRRAVLLLARQHTLLLIFLPCVLVAQPFTGHLRIPDFSERLVRSIRTDCKVVLADVQALPAYTIVLRLVQLDV